MTLHAFVEQSASKLLETNSLEELTTTSDEIERIGQDYQYNPTEYWPLINRRQAELREQRNALPK